MTGAQFEIRIDGTPDIGAPQISHQRCPAESRRGILRTGEGAADVSGGRALLSGQR